MEENEKPTTFQIAHEITLAYLFKTTSEKGLTPEVFVKEYKAVIERVYNELLCGSQQSHLV